MNTQLTIEFAKTKNKTEIWKDIVGYEGYYQVSNYGRIRTLDKISKNRWGEYLKRGKMRKLYLTKHGYVQMDLSKFGRKKSFKVHRLLAIAFIPNPENKRCVNHIDGNKTNNHIDNLEWVTDSENVIHGFKIGLITRPLGQDHHGSKLTDKDVLYIRSEKSISNVEIAKKYGLCRSTIIKIKSRILWSHI